MAVLMTAVTGIDRDCQDNQGYHADHDPRRHDMDRESESSHTRRNCSSQEESRPGIKTFPRDEPDHHDESRYDCQQADYNMNDSEDLDIRHFCTR